MYSLSEITQKGKLFRKQFNNIDFVGEIEIPEAELKRLCSSLWKSLNHIGRSDDLCALLTTVVVNLAYYTRDDYDSDSFRWLVLNKLSNSRIEDNDIWTDYIGAPTLRTLKTYFHVQDRPGRAYRYVRPIMQQAGVPYSTIPQFVNFFLQLANQFGVPFSYQDYEKFRHHHQVQSHTLSNFLATETGFHYCKEIARIYKNLKKGLLNYSEIADLPPRIRETVKILYQRSNELPRSKVKESSIALPQLALDKEQLRLKLLFPLDGINSSASYWLNDGFPIYQASYFLNQDELKNQVISGSILTLGKKESWQVEIWQPETNPWAIFSVSSGSYIQSNGKIVQGEYIVVLPAEYDLPHALEDYGYFYYPGKTTYRVFHARLNNGFAIPEIGLEVGRRTSSVPQLRFSNSQNVVRYCANVFIDKIPPILIDNWDEENSRNYFLLLDRNGISSRIPSDLISDGTLNYPFEAPTNAQIRLEPKGKTTKEFRQPSLSFTVLPKDFQFVWKNVLYEKSARPNFEIKPYEKVEVVTLNNLTVNVTARKWEVFQEIDLLDLHLKYDKSAFFSLSVPVYRLNVFGEIIENNLLWQEKLNQRAEINLSLSPNERKQNVELGLVINEGFIKICDSKPVSNNLFLQITTDEIKDAFEDCGIPAGIFAIKISNGNVIKSDVIYANDGLIKNRTFEETDKFNQWSKYLPEDLRKSIEAKRKIHLIDERQEENLPLNIPDSIKDWLQDPRQDFEVIQKTLRSWCEACRNKYWKKAEQTEIGLHNNGKFLIEAARIYHDAIEALENYNLKKYNLFLESSYKKLNTLHTFQGVGSQIAAFIRLMCCLRLGEIEAAQKEVKSLEDYWCEVVLLLNRQFPALLGEKTNTKERFVIDDVVIHDRDLEFLSSKKL